MDQSLYVDAELARIPALKDKAIIVTGAGSGIGRSAALVLAHAGARLMLADWDEANGLATVDDIRAAGGIAGFLRIDVSCEASVVQLIDATVCRYGRLDAALNNAGITQFGPFHETRAEEFQRVSAINLSGVFYCMKHQIARMRTTGGGAIVNVASLAGISAFGDNAAYCASKFGVVGLTLTAAHDYGDQGIRANAVCPGMTWTPALEAAGQSDRLMHRIRQIPLGRAGTPREIAQVAAWLLSDGASYVTGVILPIDGGLMTGPYYTH